MLPKGHIVGDHYLLNQLESRDHFPQIALEDPSHLEDLGNLVYPDNLGHLEDLGNLAAPGILGFLDNPGLLEDPFHLVDLVLPGDQ